MIKGLKNLTFILATIFLLAGGVGTLSVYLFGASSYGEYLQAGTAPFAGCFFFAGFLGLKYTFDNRFNAKCLLGFIIVAVCYFGVETIFSYIGEFI